MGTLPTTTTKTKNTWLDNLLSKYDYLKDNKVPIKFVEKKSTVHSSKVYEPKKEYSYKQESI